MKNYIELEIFDSIEKYPKAFISGALPTITDNKNIDSAIFNRAEIARRLGISKSYVHALLNGVRKSKKRLNQIVDLINNSSKAA